MLYILKHWWAWRPDGISLTKLFRLYWQTKNEMKRAKNCKHKGYTFKKHGRCCHSCGKMLTDFGD